MIFDELSHWPDYQYIPRVGVVLKLMCALDINGIPADGLVFLDGAVRISRIFVHTKPAQQGQYEAHQKYMDIHLTLQGTEVIHVAPVHGLSAVSAFDTEKDIGFYQGDPLAAVTVTKGHFLACYPQDAHKVCVCKYKPETVEKLIVKVRLD